MLRTTTNTPKVKIIISFILFMEEADLLRLIKARSDLSTLFTLCCKIHKLPVKQIIGLLPTDEDEAVEIWRVLRFPPGYCVPWDWNWQPRLSGDPSEITNEFHSTVCGTVF
jgi:hypothetical protein